MNLELIARLNSDHIQELHGDAHRNRQARIALRLGRLGLVAARGSAAGTRIVERLTPGSSHDCCPAAS